MRQVDHGVMAARGSRPGEERNGDGPARGGRDGDGRRSCRRGRRADRESPEDSEEAEFDEELPLGDLDRGVWADDDTHADPEEPSEPQVTASYEGYIGHCLRNFVDVARTSVGWCVMGLPGHRG